MRDATGLMPDNSDHNPQPSGDRLLEGRLDSWKEIAAYLGRGVRTVQRWEREEGLPIHRLAHDKRGTIYAKRAELAAWWESRRVALSAESSAESHADTAPAPPRLERVTRTSAMTAWPALSSDARLAAYVSDGGDDGTTPQIWVQQVGGAALRLTTGEREYSNLSFSPDDTRILFTARDESGPNIYEIPTLGGEARLVLRGAGGGQFSPDGKWLACIPPDAKGIRLAARGGAGFRTVAHDLVDVATVTWLPDSRSILAYARPDSEFEPDLWVVPIDGGAQSSTGLLQRIRQSGVLPLPTGTAFVEDSLILTTAGPQGVSLCRQRLVPSTLQPAGALERLTAGAESAWLPTAAAGRLAFLSSRADSNLWSVAVDEQTGIARGPLRRMTRGPGIIGFLSIAQDFRTLAYYSVRLGDGDIFLRDLANGSEKLVTEGPDGPKGYPALSPSGAQLAFGQRMMGGERSARPIFVARPADGTWRTLGDDCGGRPRQWVDERLLIIERFARLNSVALIDTETGEQRDVLRSDNWSIKNPRLSPDGARIAFDASRPGEPVNVYVAPFREELVPEAEWVVVDRAASHPFWSADGRILYYTPTGTNPIIRSEVRGRRFSAAGHTEGDPISVYASAEMAMPAYLPGTTPIATRDEIIFVLGDFRGDIWLMDLQ